MTRTRFFRRGGRAQVLPATLLICSAFAPFTAACAARSAKVFDPKSIPPKQGAVVGHVRVFKGEDDVTGSCFVHFTDEKKENIDYSLDDSGWVFITLPEGPRYLSFVRCAVWNGLMYGTDQLRFDVAGQGRTTYFGDVRFYLADEDAKAFWNAVGAGVAGVPVTSVAGALAATGTQAVVTSVQLTSPDGVNRVTAEDRIETALAQYARRFHKTPDIAISLAGAPPEPAPTVRKNGTVLSVDTRMNGLLVVWSASLKGNDAQLVVRMNRVGVTPLFANCKEAEIISDGAISRHPIAYTAQRGAEGHREAVEFGIDRGALHSVARARAVEIRTCKVKSTLSRIGIQAATNLANALPVAVADLPPKAPEPEQAPAIPVPPPQPPEPAASPAEQPSPSL